MLVFKSTSEGGLSIDLNRCTRISVEQHLSENRILMMMKNVQMFNNRTENPFGVNIRQVKTRIYS